MEDNEDMVTTTETVEQVETANEEKKEKTFTRAEVNKMINAEKQKERQNVLNEIKEKEEKSEAEKLADLNENEKMNTLLKRIEATENKLKAKDLEAETLKQADNKGIPLELVKTLDFEKETADSINSKLEIFEKTTKAERERAIKEYSKEPTPTTGDEVNSQDNLSDYEKFAQNFNKK